MLLVLHGAGVVVMHAASTGMASCPAALQRLISFYKRRGCKLVKVTTWRKQLQFHSLQMFGGSVSSALEYSHAAACAGLHPH